MSILKTIVPKPERAYATQLRRRSPDDPRQRGLMVGSLCLLLLALSIVLWHDRDFWFPDSQEANADLPAETAKALPAREAAPPAKLAPMIAPAVKPDRRSLHKSAKARSAKSAPASSRPAQVPVVATNRTVLPPLEVEVVAGDNHRVIRPGSNSLHVDLQPGTSPQPAVETGNTGIAASMPTYAAGHVRISADASTIVTSPVKPNYPLLARQMKVQGSVILQALIGKDGSIQNLRLVSGPRILASAAENAVRQWHFKPHFEGAEAVETQAKITVNFTISTN